MFPSERPTKPDLGELAAELEESPTLRAWEVEAIQELELQVIRLKTGRACRPCLGRGMVERSGGYWVACNECGGKGMS